MLQSSNTSAILVLKIIVASCLKLYLKSQEMLFCALETLKQSVMKLNNIA